MDRDIDVLVIGAGPAGLAAATEAATAGCTCAVVDAMGPGGQLMNMGVVHDFPDAPEGTAGPDLLSMLIERAMEAGAEIGFGEATAVRAAADGRWQVETSEGSWLARAVVVATGLGKGTTGSAGEDAFEGRGLSHCANCDGPLYAGKPVVVEGAGEWAAAEAIELAGIAARVTLVSDKSTWSAAREAALAALPNVERIEGRIVGLEGGDGLAAVVVEGPAGSRRVETAALFALAGRRPASTFLGALLQPDAGGHVAVDGEGAAGRPGLFACGDVTSGAETITRAIADGTRAGQNAARRIAGG